MNSNKNIRILKHGIVNGIGDNHSTKIRNFFENYQNPLVSCKLTILIMKIFTLLENIYLFFKTKFFYK